MSKPRYVRLPEGETLQLHGLTLRSTLCVVEASPEQVASLQAACGERLHVVDHVEITAEELDPDEDDRLDDEPIYRPMDIPVRILAAQEAVRELINLRHHAMDLAEAEAQAAAPGEEWKRTSRDPPELLPREQQLYDVALAAITRFIQGDEQD